MNYEALKECMHQFRCGYITRAEMVAAFALWQRPIDCVRGLGEREYLAVEAVIR